MTDETTNHLLAVTKNSHEKLENNPSIHSIPNFLANLGSGFMPYDDKLIIPSMIVTTLENPNLALLSDSFHLLSDLVSFTISLLSIYLSHRPASKSHSYGYYRAEILGALFSILLIWILTCFLCLEAYDRISNPKEVDGKTMFIISCIGVFVNLLLIFVLGHTHFHSHDSKDNKDSHNNGDGVNIRAALLHVFGDLLSSLGVLISSIVIIYDPSKVWVDPLCTFFFSVLVMATTFGILKSSIRVLMEATPPHIDIQAVKLDLKSIEGVRSVHDLHVWDLTVGKTILVAHLKLQKYSPTQYSETFTRSSILSMARKMLRKKYNIFM
ncbi:11411_t:CDS:2, partial [Acaulospora morrowiae]